MRVFLWLGVTRQHQPGTIHHGNPDLDHLDRRQFFEHRGRRQSRRVQHQAVLQGDLQTVSQERNQRVRWLTSRQRGASFRWLGLCDRKPSAATSWPCGPPSARESCPKKWTFQAEGTRPSLPSAGRGAKNGRISSCSPAATRGTFSRGVEPPLFPCPKNFTFWDTTLLPWGTFWVRVRGPFYGHSACSRRAGGKTAFGVRGRTGEDLNQNVPLRQLSRVPEGELLRTGDYGSLTSSAIRRRTGDCPPANQLQGNE